MMCPLPQLCPRNLRGSCVFHQVVDGNASQPIEPRRQVAQTDIYVHLQTLARDLTLGHSEQVGRLHLDARVGRAIWFPPGICSSKTALATGTNRGCATHVVMSGLYLAQLVLAHSFHGNVISNGIAFDRNLRRHAPIAWMPRR